MHLHICLDCMVFIHCKPYEAVATQSKMPRMAEGGVAVTPQKLLPKVYFRTLSVVLLLLGRDGDENGDSGVNDCSPGDWHCGESGGTAMNMGRNCDTLGEVTALRT